MSLETLRQNLITEAQGGQIRINAGTFTNAGLTPPDRLDELLRKAFVDVDPVAGLAINTTDSQIGPIQDDSFFMVGGTIDVQIANDKQVQIKFSATGTQGTLVIGIELTDAWDFGQSYPSLTGKMFADLKAKNPYFFFAGQQENAYPWSNTTVELEPGLNFAGSVSLTGYLSTVISLLPDFSPEPSYVLSGTIDSSQEVQTTPEGEKYSYPGLILTSTKLASNVFEIGYLRINAPYLSITLVDYGGDAGPSPAVMLAAALDIPGGPHPEFSAQLPVSPEIQVAAFSVVDPRGGLALTADQLFALMAGQTWFGLVPPALSSFMQNFGFRSFGAVVSYGSTLSISNVQVVIASGSPWVVWDDPLLALTFELDWTIQSPFQTGQSQYAVLVATARFMPELFPGEFEFSIDTDLVVSGRYVALSPAEYVSFNALAEAVTGGIIKVPEQFISIEFQEFYATINQPARSYTFSSTTSIKLPIVGEGKFELNDTALMLSVQRPEPSGGQPVSVATVPLAANEADNTAVATGTRYNGSISGSLIVGPLFLLAEGSYIEGVWTFRLAMQPGTVLGLQT